MTKITLTRVDFDVLPHWPYEKLPLRKHGNCWKYKIGPRWRVAGFEDIDDIPMIVLYEDFVIQETEEAK